MIYLIIYNNIIKTIIKYNKCLYIKCWFKFKFNNSKKIYI